MDLAEIQQKIHVKYEGNIDYYSEDDEDYLVRLSLINDSIDEWETGGGDEVIEWPELKSTTTVSLSNTIETYALSSTIRMLSGRPKVVRADSSYFQLNYKPSYRYEELVKLGIPGNIFTVIGTPGSRSVKIRPIPTATETSLISETMISATRLATSTDAPEMSKPMFIVFRVVARLHELDGATDLMQVHDDEADKLLLQMKRAMFISPEGNQINLKIPGRSSSAFGT